MFNIELKDGTLIKELSMNGNNFVSSEIIEEDMLTNENLKEVKITEFTKDEEGEPVEEVKVYHNMYLVQIMERKNKESGEDEWLFILAQKTKEQMEKKELNKLLEETEESITDIEVAIAEVYEMIIGGLE